MSSCFPNVIMFIDFARCPKINEKVWKGYKKKQIGLPAAIYQIQIEHKLRKRKKNFKLN